MAANIKFAVYKIFNGQDFDTVYFKAPASAITETATKIVDGKTITGRQFITPEDNAKITDYLTTFNTAGKLVQLEADGKIDSDLISESFSSYLDKRHTPGALQFVASEVTFTNTSGVHSEFGFNINGASANPENINKLHNASTGTDKKVKLSIGMDNANQEIEFTKNGELNFKKETVINNITVGDENSAVPRIYVDNALESGAKPIAAVKAATKAEFDPMPSGLMLTPDGVSVVVGDRVLLKNQQDKTKNGIYRVSSGLWTRDNTDSNKAGALVFVEEGTTYNDSKWYHEGGGNWIKFSQTDQTKFPANGGLVKTDDDVKLQTNYITDDHIFSNAGIDLSKLKLHLGSATNWDLPTTIAAPITDFRSVSERLTDLALTISRIRGGTGNAADYGAWTENSYSILGNKTAIDKKQNPVDWGTADPSPSLFKKGDVYLLYDQET